MNHQLRSQGGQAGGEVIGKRVQQGELVGYVGMTGLATGPHLHYEYLVNGVQRNPATIPLPRTELPAKYQAEFTADAEVMLAKLDLTTGSGVPQQRLASR